MPTSSRRNSTPSRNSGWAHTCRSSCSPGSKTTGPVTGARNARFQFDLKRHGFGRAVEWFILVIPRELQLPGDLLFRVFQHPAKPAGNLLSRPFHRQFIFHPVATLPCRALWYNPSMRAVVQRVSRASVSVNRELTGNIAAGLLVLLGVAHED